MKKSTKQTKIKEYIEHQKELVEMERKEEMEAHQREIENLTGKERQEKGRAILNLKSKDEGDDLAGYLVKFSRQKRGEKLPETKISVGDLVMISKEDPTRDDNPTGTVTKTTNYSITAAFDEKPPGFVYSKGLRADLYVNDITFQRMKEALDKLEEPRERLKELRDFIIGTKEIPSPQEADINEWHNEELNDSQKEAVRRALGAEDVFLIHGPPGTGKTTTVIEVIEQYVDEGKSVLATADSNAAVDNMVEFLTERGVQTVRVGHPARVTKLLRDHTLDSLIQQKESFQEAKRLKEKAFALKDEQKEYTFPSGPNRRGLSNKKIKSLADRSRGSRGINPKKIQSMAGWIRLQEDIEELFQTADWMEAKAVNEILSDFDVVCTTNSTAGSSLMEDRVFDVLVVDEATQATEPSCLIPAVCTDEIIMAGDHKQLPPTVQSQEAQKEGLDFTLFERLAQREGDRIKDMLTIQYRMHEDIMNFSNEHFYDSKIKAAPSVADHTLQDLDFDTSQINTKFINILDPANPVVFIDTKNTNSSERSRPGSHSKENKYEATLASQLAENLLQGGLEPKEVAVISPYDDQTDLISGMIDEDNLEVKTVDGFQGREKEAIIISLVRSNSRGNIGFLSDLRRLNVALTRAKRKLIVIGDSETLNSSEDYSELIKYIKEVGRYTKTKD